MITFELKGKHRRPHDQAEHDLLGLHNGQGKQRNKLLTETSSNQQGVIKQTSPKRETLGILKGLTSHIISRKFMHYNQTNDKPFQNSQILTGMKISNRELYTDRRKIGIALQYHHTVQMQVSYFQPLAKPEYYAD